MVAYWTRGQAAVEMKATKYMKKREAQFSPCQLCPIQLSEKNEIALVHGLAALYLSIHRPASWPSLTCDPSRAHRTWTLWSLAAIWCGAHWLVVDGDIRGEMIWLNILTSIILMHGFSTSHELMVVHLTARHGPLRMERPWLLQCNVSTMSATTW